MQDNFDVLTLIFLGLAIFVIVKLRSVLGTRTGAERPPFNPLEPSAPKPAPNGRENGNVVPLNPAAAARLDQPEPDPADLVAAMTGVDAEAKAGLVEIIRADRGFAPAEFVSGAKAAYEMIVLAFASGDRRMLKDLLSKEVFDGFVAAITQREKRGETVETRFVSIDRAEISEAALKAKTAHVTVRFVSKLITATRDQAGAIIDGSPEKVTDVTDIWTFARDIGSRDPNWRLVATESGQ